MLSSKEHFDLIRIKEKSNGDLVFLGDIYAEFLLEIPKKMHSIKMFLKENKKDEILKICHSLIGILPLFGMESSLTIILKNICSLYHLLNRLVYKLAILINIF